MLKNEPLEDTPSSRKSDRTRQHLLEISLKAFKKKGYDACTMRDLAKEAGVTAPAFYYYFRSKEEIVAAFYAESLQEHLAGASEGIIKGAPLAENLKRMIRQRFEELKDHRETLGVLKRFSFDRENILSPFHEDHRFIRKASVNLFEQIIDRSRGKIPLGLKRELAQILWLFHLLILFYWIGDKSPGFKKTLEFLDRSVSYLTAGLILLKVPGARRSVFTLIEILKNAELLEAL